MENVYLSEQKNAWFCHLCILNLGILNLVMHIKYKVIQFLNAELYMLNLNLLMFLSTIDRYSQ